MMNYDPNLVLCGRTAKQRVRLTFGQWDYRKTIETIASGNCQGLDVIECAAETVYDRLGDDVMGNKEIRLAREGGEELICSDGARGCDGYSFLKEMLIAAEIIDIKPETENGRKEREK
jgi:hypothetical protein